MRVLPQAGPERTRTLALLGLLAVLVAWVWWPAGPSGVQTAPVAGNGPATATPGSATTAVPAPSQSLLPQRVQLPVSGATPEPVNVGRNLFRFGSRPAPPPPPPLASTPPPPPPPRPTGPPPVPLRLAGLFLAPDGRTVATLRDSGTGALFHATEGDAVDGRYKLIKVGAQSAIVSYLDGSGQRTIVLGGG